MDITVNIKNSVLVVSLSGELDHHTSKEVKNLIEKAIKNKGIKNLVLDFSNLTFMDSSGIGVVVGRYKLVTSLGGNLAIAGAKNNTKKLLYMSGINKIIKNYDCVDDAIFAIEGVI